MGVGGRFNVEASWLGYAATGYETREINTYRGIFQFDLESRFRDITDGLSNTALFGEVTGEFDRTPYDGVADLEAERKGVARARSIGWLCSAQNMHFNGCVLADTTTTPNPAEYEDTRRRWINFSSMHTGNMIQFCLADGAVRQLLPSTDWPTMYRYAGMADGQPHTTTQPLSKLRLLC